MILLSLWQLIFVTCLLTVNVLNVDEETRLSQLSIRIVGIIPSVGEAATYTDDELAERKQRIMHLCIAHFLADFNSMHDIAKVRRCPDGKMRKTRLFLAAWPGDLKEHWALCLMTQGYCHMCKCPKGQLSATDGDHEAWRPDAAQQRYEDIKNGRVAVDRSYPIKHLRSAFWDIKSFDVHKQACVDIMHNWSLGIVLHVIDAVVWEQSRFLRSYTAATSDTQIISDAAIVRHFTIAMKNNMNDYANGASCIPLTERARKRLGRVAEALVGKKKKPSNLRADEADALLQALPTALEDSLADFAPDLRKAGFPNPLAEDPTAEIIPAISGMLQVLNTHASVHTFFLTTSI